MSNRTVDAVVIGGGHYGLVAANVLADAGWDVCLLEAADTVGGAVRSAELHPGFTADLYSAFYPLALGSPVLRAMELERHGLRWSYAPTVLTHLLGPDDERAAVLYRDRERTAAGLDEHAPGDGEPGSSCAGSGTWSASPCCGACSPPSHRCVGRCSCCAGSAPPRRCACSGS